MARGESPPFRPGETYFQGTTVSSTDGAQYEGQEYLFEDIDYTTGQRRTNHPLVRKIVRNVSGVALLGKRLVKFKKTGAAYGGQVDGYATGNAVCPGNDECFPTDEWLPTAGVPNNDLFFITVSGPAMCQTTLNDSATVDIAVGGRVAVATTQAATTGTTAGRIEAIQVVNHTDPTGTTQTQSIQNFANVVGRALTAKTTAQTNADVLVLVTKF